MAEKTKALIDRTNTIDSIFSSYPEKAPRLAQELTNAGLHCVGCSAATWETLEAGAASHGMSGDQIDGLVRRLNAILDEKLDLTNITITARAARKFLSILEAEGKDGWGLRFAEKPGGCGGYEYVLDYSESAQETDTTYESQGIQIHLADQLAPHLLGAEIDYVDGLQGSGFKISNPNVRSSCKCGSSHSY